jgi:hypothetical protein
MIHQLGGLMVVHSARVHRQVFVSVLAHQPDRPNSNDDLWRDISSSLSDFSLTATTGGPCPVSVAGAHVPTNGNQDAIADQANSFDLIDLTA